jgi:hypothetical protein
MTDREVMQMALEIIETHHGEFDYSKEIAILRAQLEQPEQEPKPWSSLTPEEILDLFDRNNVYGSKWIEFARAVEEKLKEKSHE